MRYMMNPKLFDGKIRKLRAITDRALEKNDIDKAMAALGAMATLKYQYNQHYVDEYIEEKVGRIAADSKRLKSVDKSIFKHGGRSDRVLFYDGFGLDTRGLARIYLKALVSLGYSVMYVTKAASRDIQPQVMRILECGNCTVYNLGILSYGSHLKKLREIFEEEVFDAAFFYTTPNDISGAVAFSEMAGRCRRYLINLTDHAFWVGRDSVDYCIEFREYGASISHYYRGFDKGQLLELPYYPLVSHEAHFQGFPETLKGKKVIFSGGALYKTIDEDGTYYRIVERIIQRHDDVGFLYAGSGEDSHIRKLVSKYPHKVAFVPERNDLYEVLKHSYLYLNTYPISGALMLQYAVIASCIPITLKREWDDDVSGILLHEDILGETFTNEGDLIREIDRLITDTGYKKQKEGCLSQMIIMEDDFENRLDQIIRNPVSPYKRELTRFDTEEFREIYRQNFNREKYLNNLITRDSRAIYRHFPKELIARVFYKLKRNNKM